ncbi:MAG: ACT domain-containing protein, partial [Armatimonadetes bacterium]|nr:ACT domain-containing protein [Armatimonadota bacterium]
VEKRESSAGDYASIIATALITSTGRHDIAGTVFGKSEPRIIRLDGYRMDIVPEGHVLLSDHTDKAGVIGRVGTEIGKVGVNIAGMHVGRQKIGGDAIMVLNVDAQLPDELLDYLSTLDNISNARMVDFSI